MLAMATAEFTEAELADIKIQFELVSLFRNFVAWIGIDVPC